MRIYPLNLLAVLLAASLAGCAANSKMPIPHRGDTMAEGANTQLSVRAPSMGLVSVYDDTSRSLVHSGVVGPGTIVNLNPVTGTISVTDFQANGSQVVYTAVNRSHHYVMTFIPQDTGESTTGATTQGLSR
jgi:hypothetical protein